MKQLEGRSIKVKEVSFDNTVQLQKSPEANQKPFLQCR
jgi:hypothetical protein